MTVGIKNRGGVVTRSDALGTYRVPGFGKDVDTKDVDVSCEKEGYKQVKTVRRTAPADARSSRPSARSARLEHDPEKWTPVFGKDHAPPIM